MPRIANRHLEAFRVSALGGDVSGVVPVVANTGRNS